MTPQLGESPDVFVAYKREDHARASRLVRALEDVGFRVWWDQHLPLGQSWQQSIAEALRRSSCAVVLWSEGSVGPEGDFVRDEARLAKQAGRLVPVLIDKVIPPLGFGEVQAVDLSHWRGQAKDLFFQDLVSAIGALAAGTPIPPPRGPTQRKRRRLALGASSLSLLALIALLIFDALDIQPRLCTLPIGQPGLSDACGALRWGSRPTKAERLAWEAVDAQSCVDLRMFLARYPDGQFSRKAQGLLASSRLEPSAKPVLEVVELRGFVRRPQRGTSGGAAARSKALELAQADAEELLCKPTDIVQSRVGVTVTPLVAPRGEGYRCEAQQGGIGCSLDFVAVCKFERLPLVERCGDVESAP